MLKIAEKRSIYLRAVRIYLLTIVALVTLFIIINLISWGRQKEAQSQLSDSLLVTNGQSLAVEFERHIWELVENCLRDPEVRQVCAAIRSEAPSGMAGLTSRIQKISSGHPIAAEIYAIRDTDARIVELKTASLAEGRDPGIEGRENAKTSAESRNLKLIQSFAQSDNANDRLVTERVYSLAFQQDNGNSQAFVILLHTDSREKEALGIAVDQRWLQEELLPQCKRELENRRIFTWMYNISDSKPQQDSPGQSFRIPFRTILPFWELEHTSSGIDTLRQRLGEDLIYRGIGMAMLIAVLGLATFLLIRLSPELGAQKVRAYLLSGLSHELKTPLTLIRLYAETLVRDKTLPEADRSGFHQIILRESERLSNLVESLLDFTKMETPGERYRMVEGNLFLVVQATLDMCDRWVSHLGFRIHRDLSTDLPPVRFDSEKITQAVLNLVDNARKYSGTSKDIWVNLRSDDSRVILEVRDQGIGIPPEESEKVFRPFYRGRQRSNKPGFGLGLYLLRRIMNVHGGSIEMSSEPGSGTTMRLIFHACRSIPVGEIQLNAQPDSSVERS